MAISRAQLAKELEPGLNALFGMEYIGTKTNTQRSTQQNLLIEHSKRK